MKRLSQILDKIADICGHIGSALVPIMVGMVAVEVFMRYVVEAPTVWANELSLWIAGFVFLFSGLYAMQQRSHIRIFLLYDVMPRWLQNVCDTISTLLIVVFAVALIHGGFGEAYAKFLRWETFGTAFDHCSMTRACSFRSGSRFGLVSRSSSNLASSQSM